MNLNTTTLCLSGITATAGSSNMRAQVWFHDVPGVAQTDLLGVSGAGRLEYPGNMQRSLFQNVETIICNAPTTSNTIREIDEISIYNNSADTEIITIATCDGVGVNIREIITKTLLTKQSLLWILGHGWYVEGT